MRYVAVLVIALTTLAGAARADLAAGFDAYRRGDFATALAELRPLAEAGAPEAQQLLGEMYLHGNGVPADFTTAAEWLRKAARTGHSQAQLALAGLYANGLGVPQDTGLAYFWMIYAVVGADGPVRDQAMGSLGHVASQLTAMQKAQIARRAIAAWGR